jgi:hypothetical protein
MAVRRRRCLLITLSALPAESIVKKIVKFDHRDRDRLEGVNTRSVRLKDRSEPKKHRSKRKKDRSEPTNDRRAPNKILQVNKSLPPALVIPLAWERASYRELLPVQTWERAEGQKSDHLQPAAYPQLTYSVARRVRVGEFDSGVSLTGTVTRFPLRNISSSTVSPNCFRSSKR